MSKPDFNKIASDLEIYIKDTLPTAAGEMVIDKIDDNFDDESFNGDKWQALSTKYAARKGSGKKILSDTGDMRSGIDFTVEDGAVIIGSDTTYAKYHNEGGSEDGRPPQRQIIPTEESPDEDLNQDIYDMIESDLDKIILNK